ncbi:2OG-Fe(II) oxygenase, partial [Psychrobacter sp. 16-Bac2893]
MTKIISNLDVTTLVVDNPIGKENPPLLSLHSTNYNNQALPTQHLLQSSDFLVNWEHKLTDKQLDTFVDDGWLIIDDVFERKALVALQAESGFIDYRDAQLTAGIRISDIRGDKIRWITKDFFAGFYYL